MQFRNFVARVSVPWVRVFPLLLAACLPLAAAEIIAHRGASRDAPENTLPSVRLGWERNADAVEIDVHLSKDGKIVVLHDYDTKRTSGVDRPVVEQTLAELKQLDAGRWKAERWAGTRIPTLGEVIATVPEGKKLFVEVKCGVEVVDELERVFNASGKLGRMVVISFDYDVVVAVKRRMPDVPVYWLYNFRGYDPANPGDATAEALIEKTRRAGADGLDLNHEGPVDRAFADKVRAAGMKLYVYTVNSPDDARRLESIGVAGITTDRPRFLRDALNH